MGARAGLVMAVLLLPEVALGEEPRGETGEVRSWAAFAEARKHDCVGPRGSIEPIEISAGKRLYRLEGHRLEQIDRRSGTGRLRIGVLSATKDDRPETIRAVRGLIEELKRLGADLLVVNGDLATHEIDLEELILPTLAGADLLAVVHIGNSESCGSFNRAAEEVFRRSPNLINGNWVREIALVGGTLLTMPGYHDRRFTHSGGAAMYDDEDLAEVARMMRAAPEPKVLVAHGPPHMAGRFGIDLALGAGHVGDPKLTELIAREHVRFGIFGHILEAGGRGSDLTGRKRRKPGTRYDSLYVNAGSANPDPWLLLGGRTSRGMALFFELGRKGASYRVLQVGGT